ncbi:MAG TPA: hypothetical protein ENG22_04475 [Candidatus Bathyarchaeota archaeon]|nr:hypothetical protein [Candidatus Bathyarchaeota archaeon]
MLTRDLFHQYLNWIKVKYLPTIIDFELGTFYRIEYKAIPVKSLLKELKRTASITVDLAYASILFNDEELAKEVVDLNEYASYLCYQVAMSSSMFVKDKADAEVATTIVHIAYMFERLSSIAADMAKMVLRKMQIPDIVREAFRKTEEEVCKVVISPSSILANKKLKKLRLQSKIGTDIIAIKRKGKWIIGPKGKDYLKANDVTIARGCADSLEVYSKLASGELRELKIVEFPEAPEKKDYRIEDILCEMLVDLKDTSEYALELAYFALIYENKDVAKEVLELEEYMDKLHTKFEYACLQLYEETGDPRVVSLIRMSLAAEMMSDIAADMCEIVLRGLPAHPVLKEVLYLEEETVSLVKVCEGSTLIGKKIGEIESFEKLGIDILAIKRGGKWIFDPGDEVEILKDDLLIVSGFSESISEFQKIASGTSKEE